MVESADGRSARGLLNIPSPLRRPRVLTKGRTQDSRVQNRSLVLATLYHQGPTTRSDLAKVSGLALPTISAVVTELEGEGLVVDIGPRGDRGVGRPAILVQLNEGGAVVLALDLSRSDAFVGALLDLKGHIVERAALSVGEAQGDEARDLVVALAQSLLGRATTRVVGIGVGSPGIVDDAGVVRHAVHLGWVDLPLAALLSERFRLPTYVGNDINVTALAAVHFGGQPVQDLLLITIEHGVGAGLVVGGRLVLGEQFAAGEIGHVTVEGGDGEECVCGRRNCLDPQIDAAHLRRRLAATSPQGRPDVLARAGRALGRVLAPVVSVLNLNEIALIGPPDLVEGPFLRAAVETTKERTWAPLCASLHVRPLVGDDFVLLGSASLVLTAELGVP